MPFHDINETHDPKLESWVESANDPETDFPIQNLPFVLFWHDALEKLNRVGSMQCSLGVVIGDKILDLRGCMEAGLLNAPAHLSGISRSWAETLCWGDQWSLPLDEPSEERDGLRRRLIELLGTGNSELRGVVNSGHRLLFDTDDVMAHRAPVADYTDFYASVHHATNVGSMFRPDNPLLPNYKWLPVGYHGRASTIIPSGTLIRRPTGQQAPAEEGGQPGFGPCKMLDYEMELGFFVGRGNTHGQAVPIDQAEDHIFGMCIVNDWSARDIQKWEYQPLGPFLAKSFATTISPYIVTMEALAPFRCPALKRPDTDPKPLPHLYSEADQSRGGVDITVEVWLQSEEMARRGMSPVRLSQGNFNQMYWTISQMLAHHTSNGCLLQPGDLMASGTISGPKRENRGCLLELTWNGDPFATPPKVAPTTDRTPIELPTGEKRRFLEDGDEVIMKAYCQRDGFRRIGFGECRGKIAPAGK